MHYICLLRSVVTSLNFFSFRYLFIVANYLSLASLNVSTTHACSSITQSALGSKSIVLSALQEKKDRKYMKATDILSLFLVSSFKENGQHIQLQLSVLSEMYNKRSEKLLIGSHQYHFLLRTQYLSIRARNRRSVYKSIRFGCKWNQHEKNAG